MRLIWTHSRIRILQAPGSHLGSFPHLTSFKHRRHIFSSSQQPRAVHAAFFNQRWLLQRRSSSIASNPHHLPDDVYIREVDLEEFEAYTDGGYHPIVIGDTFYNGRYEVVHKLGFGGYSTIWLARDKQSQRYVALKVLVASEFSKSTEVNILRLLCRSDSGHQGRQFIPRLLDQFSIDGPNGHHVCLVQEPALCSIATSKDHSANLMFPVETARSIAAQLIMGLSYLHSRGVCHGGRLSHPPVLIATFLTYNVTAIDLHMRNFLIYSAVGVEMNHLSLEEI